VESADAAQLALLAKPKPGSCCSTKSAAHKHGDAGGCESNSCACKSAASGSAATAAAAAGSARELMVSGGVPPKRMKECKVVGRRPQCGRCAEKLANVNARDQISCRSRTKAQRAPLATALIG